MTERDFGGHLFTADEREIFERDGYLALPGALSPELNDQLVQAVDRCWEKGFEGDVKHDRQLRQRLNMLGFIGHDRLFFDMVCNEKILPKIFGILGWNIYLYHSHLAVSGRESGHYDPSGQTWGWHQDSGQLNFDLETDPRPRVSAKVAYFITDVSEPGRGNFWVKPGSHLDNKLVLPPDGRGQPEGAVPVLASPGDAVIFDRRLWHSATPNYSDTVRKVLFYGYGYRWLHARDEMVYPAEWYETADPIMRQMLGYSSTNHGRTSPSDEDVPLRAWMKENSAELAAV